MCLADLIDFPVDRLPAALPKTWRDIHTLSAVPPTAPASRTPTADGAADLSTTTTQGNAP